MPLSPDDNVSDLLEARVRDTPDRPLFAVPAGDSWRDVSAADFHARVVRLAKGFIAAGVEPGDRVAFMCGTKYEWSLVDFALFYAGAVMVPVYETSSAKQLLWILRDSGARAIVTESAEHAERFLEIGGEVPLVSLVLRMDEGALAKLEDDGVDVSDDAVNLARSVAVGADPATIIYTSGSTGRPKGCVLTHSNFVELARNSAKKLYQVVEDEGSSTLLFVTLAHVFARFISILCVHAGVRTGHQADTKLLLPSLGSFRPTFLLAVPRVFEKVYNSAEQKTDAEGKGKIFRLAAHIAVAHSAARQKGKVPFLLDLKFKLFGHLVYGKLKEKLGGRVNYAISGSAPLSTYLAHFFNSLGVQILEGYGLTESTAPVSVNLPGNFKIGTVGPPLPGHTVRIAEDGEVQIKGIDVFKEYWNNPEETRAAFTDDGFFCTGDLGELDEDGYLKITGRKKEILVTAGGKNVAPAALEDPIRANSIISQVVVVGDKRPFIGALVTLDREMLTGWLGNNGENPDMPLVEAAANPKVIAEVRKAIQLANENVSRAESIRKFLILEKDFTEDDGHMTPKMSIKRHNILKDYAAEIEDIYAADAAGRSENV